MALLNAYLYLLFIDLEVGRHDASMPSLMGHIRHYVVSLLMLIGPVGACINVGCMIAVEP